MKVASEEQAFAEGQESGRTRPAANRSKSRYVFWAAGSLLALAVLGLVVWIRSTIVTLEKRLEEVEWSQESHYSAAHQDKVTPDVGTIQFLNHAGVSLTLNSVRYTSEGLAITGTLGNPRQLWLSTVTLRLQAHKPYWSLREQWNKAKNRVWFFYADENVMLGVGESEAIPLIRPGGTAEFSVLIPNVKQAQDNRIELDVSLNGVRYSY